MLRSFPQRGILHFPNYPGNPEMGIRIAPHIWSERKGEINFALRYCWIHLSICNMSSENTR